MLLLVLLAASSAVGLAQVSGEQGKPFVVEYYYKAKWGHAVGRILTAIGVMRDRTESFEVTLAG